MVQSKLEKYSQRFISLLSETDEKNAKTNIHNIKVKICRELNLTHVPSNAEILQSMTPKQREKWVSVLKTKRVRSGSGVLVVAVMTQPIPCPHGKCMYCPGGPTIGAPQSYTGLEPAALRAIQNQYDPYMQVTNRLNQLHTLGHHLDKVEIIVMGGTFPATPASYQEGFIKGCLDALNGTPSVSLQEAIRSTETAPIRNSGITLETRPDYCSQPIIDHSLSMGVTRFELGVQTVYDEVYLKVDRGHTVDAVVDATQRLKDSGLKVCYHMMTNMPGSTPQRDIEAFKTIFSDPRFSPDMLKIYPTLVLKGTQLYHDWLKGSFTAYSEETTINILADIFPAIPPWIRIQRVQRDIPAQLIQAGPTHSNLREEVHNELKNRNKKCQCIRCREIGLKTPPVNPSPDRIKFLKRVYPASGGEELFLSFEDPSTDTLVSFLRLRRPNDSTSRKEITDSSMIIRELRVYGEMTPVGHYRSDAWQHQGYGQLLIKLAEQISEEYYDANKIVITSGLGVRPYYKRFGYKQEGPYMVKHL